MADDLPEPVPVADEVLVEVRAYSINRGELFLLKMRPDSAHRLAAGAAAATFGRTPAVLDELRDRGVRGKAVLIRS